ncbi:MAG: hypothetical protein KJZ90_15475 [Rhodocyclaceae bacterium]|nr:hypothetical protein [Rhodocyclaceae bacterium]
MSEGQIKKFMYVNRKAPHGTIYALESLEVVLIAAAFDQDVSRPTARWTTTTSTSSTSRRRPSKRAA